MIYDIVIIGGGPAGMTAALYARRNGRTVLVIEKSGFGGQITHAPRVENYPGIASMTGNEFGDRLMNQILDHGADIEFETVTSVRWENGSGFIVETEEGTVHEGRSVILATGVKHRQLQLAGENELTGNGVSYCAVCDGDFFSGQEVCVAGGGNSALQDALLLAQKCRKVTILQDLPELTGEKTLQDRVQQKDNITVLTNVHINMLLQDDSRLTGVEISENGAIRSIACDGLFVAIGLLPDNQPFEQLAKLNAWGYFDSDETCLTKTPGVFVAGDCRSKAIRQLTTAVGDGATASLAACRYLDSIIQESR